MKPTLSFMDFAIVFVMLIGVAVVAHYTLTSNIEAADGTVSGKVKPTLFGGKKSK